MGPHGSDKAIKGPHSNYKVQKGPKSSDKVPSAYGSEEDTMGPHGSDKAIGTQCNVMINAKTSVVDYYRTEFIFRQLRLCMIRSFVH